MKVLLIEDSDLILDIQVAKTANQNCSCIWAEITVDDEIAVEDDIILIGRIVTHLFCVTHGRPNEKVGEADKGST